MQPTRWRWRSTKSASRRRASASLCTSSSTAVGAAHHDVIRRTMRDVSSRWCWLVWHAWTMQGLVGMPFAPVGANPGVVDRSSCVILVSFGQPSAAMLLLHDVINLERTRPELREEYVRIEPILGCYRDTDTNPLCLIVTAKWMVVL